jgi:hypothetical protein
MRSSVIEPAIDDVFGEIEDVGTRMSADLRRGRRSGAGPDQGEARVTPYPYLMQRLIAELTGSR